MTRRIVTDEQELTIRRQAEEVVRRVLEGTVPFDTASLWLQAIIEGREAAPPRPDAGADKPKRDLAAEEAQWFVQWYQGLGFSGVQIPKPNASNRDFARWKKTNSGLVWIPDTSRSFYERFMTAVGQGDHWTVADADRESIVWDKDLPTGGYWLKVELALDCPRLRTPWTELNGKHRLLALVEYAIAWYAYKARNGGHRLDTRTWCWLRSRYKFSNGQLGALNAPEFEGGVNVNWHRPEDLEIAYLNAGGRAAEAVASVA